jgi:uncharacterized protein
MALATFTLLLLLAEVLGTLGGFGSSLLVMPLAVQYLPFDQALGLTAIFHVLSNLAKIYLFRKGLDRSLLIRMGIPAVLGVVAGALLTSLADGKALRIALGLILLLLSALLFLLPRMRIRPTGPNALMGGAVSGLLAGLVGTGGAVRGVMLAAFGLEKQVFIATSAWIDLGVDLSRSVVYWGQGYLVPETWHLLPLLAVVSIVGSWIGKRILDHVDQARFEHIVLALVFLAGLFSLWNAL